MDALTMTTAVCDLVLLSWNHLDELKSCVESLIVTTHTPSRLLIVDNASEPATRQFLSTITPSGAITDIAVLQNETNEGFPRGMNHGIRASTAPFVCLLNNDLVFTHGWLEEMIAVASAHPEIGVVNPTSNTFGSHAAKGRSLGEHADSLRAQQGVYTEVGMCIGFCMLIKREVLSRVGGLSEEIDRLFFEDEDFSMQAQTAGYRCVVAAGCYVYHREHTSVREVPEREALFTKNQRWCHEKWGRRIRVAWPNFTAVVPGSAELRQWLQRLIDIARRRMHVYVYAPVDREISGNELFRSVDLVPHADIHWHSIPRAAARWSSTSLILSRQKKPFDLIAAPDDRWAQLMTQLRWVHRADVVLQSNEQEFAEQWRRKSRSLS